MQARSLQGHGEAEEGQKTGTGDVEAVGGTSEGGDWRASGRGRAGRASGGADWCDGSAVDGRVWNRRWGDNWRAGG